MLVLARKRNQKVVVTSGADRIVVTVTEIRGDKVRIGFDAPTHVKIHREEVQKEIDGEKHA